MDTAAETMLEEDALDDARMSSTQQTLANDSDQYFKAKFGQNWESFTNTDESDDEDESDDTSDDEINSVMSDIKDGVDEKEEEVATFTGRPKIRRAKPMSREEEQETITQLREQLKAFQPTEVEDVSTARVASRRDSRKDVEARERGTSVVSIGNDSVMSDGSWKRPHKRKTSSPPPPPSQPPKKPKEKKKKKPPKPSTKLAENKALAAARKRDWEDLKVGNTPKIKSLAASLRSLRNPAALQEIMDYASEKLDAEQSREKLDEQQDRGKPGKQQGKSTQEVIEELVMKEAEFKATCEELVDDLAKWLERNGILPHGSGDPTGVRSESAGRGGD